MKRLIASVAAMMCATFFVAAAAGATVVIPNPISVSAGQTSVTINVTAASQPSNKPLLVTQCKKSSADPTFNFGIDCSNLSEIVYNSGTPQPLEFIAFHGAEPSGDTDWGCFAPGETPPAGITAVTTCYIRVTNNAESNATDQEFTPMTFALTGNPTPEVPVAILLPVAAAAVIGAALFMQRRRTQTVSV